MLPVGMSLCLLRFFWLHFRKLQWILLSSLQDYIDPDLPSLSLMMPCMIPDGKQRQDQCVLPLWGQSALTPPSVICNLGEVHSVGGCRGSEVALCTRERLQQDLKVAGWVGGWWGLVENGCLLHLWLSVGGRSRTHPPCGEPSLTQRGGK